MFCTALFFCYKTAQIVKGAILKILERSKDYSSPGARRIAPSAAEDTKAAYRAK